MVHTVSCNLASAGSNEGGASLCVSIASNTNTNRKPSGRGWYLSILDNSTPSCARFSHRFPAPSNSSASATAATVVSKRWRPVMHLAELTMAWRRVKSSASSSDRFSRMVRVMADFPVALEP